jgi:hypothetical protein
MKNIIFIMGCGHSGTTLLKKIVNNHKNVYGINHETGFFAQHKLGDKDEDVINNLKNIDKRTDFNKKWMCEKTPSHVYGINKIFKLIENPKIIVIIRDGRDVTASLNKRYNDFDKSFNRWIDDNTEWLNNQHKDSFHTLRYEDLVKEPHIQLRKICEYLKEEYDDSMLYYKKEEFPKGTKEYQVNQELYDGTKRYLKDLNKQQMDLLYSNQKFMSLMNEFEYIRKEE